MVNIGVVFSGGTAKGAYQMGFSKALDERVAKNDKMCIVGSSVGALSAYILGTGKTQVAEEILPMFNVKGMYSIFKLIKNNAFYEYIDRICEYEIQQSRDVYVALCESHNLRLHYVHLNSLSKGEIKNALKASIAVPKLTKPIAVNGQPYVDAAIVNNVPIDFFIGKEVDCVFVVHFDARRVEGENVIEFQFSDELGGLRPTFDMSKENMRSMFMKGYNVTINYLDVCFPEGIKCFDNILQTNAKVRKINADYLFNMTNKVVQKLFGG